MKKIFIPLILWFFTISIKAQTISLGVDNEYCPNVEYEFTVTLPGSYQSIAPVQMMITRQPYSFNQSRTSFKFKAKFNDVNVKQYVEIVYKLGDTYSTFKPEYKKIKSLFHPKQASSSCPGIQPNQTTIIAPLCKVSNFSISFPAVKWYTANENPQFCFGSITSYEYRLPAGWKLNNINSTGSNWITGTNNVTVTSDLNTGDVILVRPKSECGTANGEFQVPIQIIRPRSFKVSPESVAITCGSTTPVTLTVENVYSASGITDYTWNLGSTPNGWIYNGSPAPPSISTNTSNTITLTPVCGFSQSNISATVTVNGISCITNTSTISVNSPSMTISGNATLCSGSSVYTLNNVPCGASVVWNAYPASGIVSLAPQGNAVTVTRTGNGRVSLSATIDACNNFSVNKDIMVGGPTPSYGGLQPVTYYPQYCTGETYYFELLGATGDADQYLWNTYSPTQGSTQYIAYSDQSVPINFPGTGTNEIVVVGTNSCGSAVVASAFIGVSNCGGWGYWVAPNPGSGNIKISVNSRLTSNSKPNQAEIQIVEITDPRGVIKYRRQFKKGFKTVDVDVTQFINGIYTVRIFDGRQWQSGKIIVQH